MPLLLLAATTLPASAPAAQGAQQSERIGASFVLALGRAPTADELEEWTGKGQLSTAELVARHRSDLERDPTAARAVMARASRDAFGRMPREDESAAAPGENLTYSELMRRHVQQLANRPTEYEEVIRQAYRRVIRRDAYPLEIEYWRHYDTLSFALLVACVENWARRNQPGLMVTSGAAIVAENSDYLTTVRLSPGVAAEARAAAGLAPEGERGSAPALGRNLVAAGAGAIVTAGRIHLVAAGKASLTENGPETP